MPTQEERLTALERFQRETIAAVREQNMFIGQQQGIISAQEVDIQRTLAILEEHSAALHEHSTAIRALLAQLPER
jgi:hypothetical protein